MTQLDWIKVWFGNSTLYSETTLQKLNIQKLFLVVVRNDASETQRRI